MAEYKDRVKDQTNTTGTGTITVDGVAGSGGYRTVAAAHTNGATLRYTIINSTGSEWEVGEGVWTSSTSTLTRATVYASSNAGGLVNFSAGAKVVFTGPVAQDLTEALPTTGGTLTGNLTFSGTGLRITGDFSNTTVASRTLFQTSTTNGQTLVTAIPNGTAVNSQFQAFNSSDPANASIASLVAASGTVRLESGNIGTGTLLPMAFIMSATEIARFDTSGNFGIGTSSPSRKLTVASESSGFPTLGTAAGGAFFSSTNGLYGLYAGVDSSTGDSWLQAMRNDSAVANDLVLNPSGGKIGVNGSPNSWGSAAAAIELKPNGGSGYVGMNASNVFGGYLYWNMFFNGTANTNIVTGVVGAYGMNGDGGHDWYVGTGTAGSASSLTLAMGINSAGRVLLGATDDTTNKLQVSGGVGIAGALTLKATNELRLADTDSTHYVGFKSPGTVTTNRVWTLPAADGTSGQVLSTNGAGVLSWATAGGGGLGNVVVLTSGTSWTVPAGVSKINATIIGGGGSGGRSGSSSTLGCGGGGGATGIAFFTVTPGGSISYSIGAGGAAPASGVSGSAGGNTVFNGVTATGGAGGNNSSNTSTSSVSASGTGLIASIDGGRGWGAQVTSTSGYVSRGGDSTHGQGGASTGNGASGLVAPSGYGSGGYAGNSVAVSTGGNQGCVIIEY